MKGHPSCMRQQHDNDRQWAPHFIKADFATNLHCPDLAFQVMTLQETCADADLSGHQQVQGDPCDQR